MRFHLSRMRGSRLLLLLVAFSLFHGHLAARHGPRHAPAAVAVVGSVGPGGAATDAASSGAQAAVRCQDGTVCGEKGLFFPPIPLVPEPPNIGGVPIPPNPITPAPSLVRRCSPPVSAIHPAAARPAAAASFADTTGAAVAVPSPPASTAAAAVHPPAGARPPAADPWRAASFLLEERPSGETMRKMLVFLLY
ncbi:hypothetical protein ZWY2020_039665 [Hordeum vulgare]|nr:hypothetical protein ZWY2020_039665 [Hordeum vulgare]